MTYAQTEVPIHLRQYIAEQDYSLYTPVDQASWRYIMRVSKDFFKDHAHPKYLKGLQETGVTTERIPRISEMDHKLQKFGWRAIIVTGFIPPEPFLEMLAHRILPIASDMRKIENIDYTPAPDIVHEAAGHAPILADPDYSSYLKKFGEIARRVIFAKEDNELYEAVLRLSETKENPFCSEEEIQRAQENLNQAVSRVGYVSEAQELTRLGWWSTEYGLYQQDGQFLIYGAGLLSSVGESYNFLSGEIQKVPLTLECIQTAYDITKPQPQLFYTDDFKKLENVIDQLAARMAYRRGGVESLAKAQRAQTLTTTELDSGIQISGILVDYRVNNEGNVIYVKYDGPTQLSFQEQELKGQGPQYHSQGFSSPLGSIKGLNIKSWQAQALDWEKIHCRLGMLSSIQFESGITVDGVWSEIQKVNDATLIMRFEQCTVRFGSEFLFKPEWGTFDLVLGENVVSVFGGAADRNAYFQTVIGKTFKPRPQKSNWLAEHEELYKLYQILRDIREIGTMGGESLDRVLRVKDKLDKEYPQDWLLRLEILELLSIHSLRPQICEELRTKLKLLAAESDRTKMLIDRGLSLIN